MNEKETIYGTPEQGMIGKRNALQKEGIRWGLSQGEIDHLKKILQPDWDIPQAIKSYRARK